MKITGEHLRAIAAARQTTRLMNDLATAVNKYGPSHGLDTRVRLASFLANAAVETGGFKRLDENLNYTSARRIRQVWPSRFPTIDAAAPFVREPVKLANQVYSGRLGNNKNGDGWTYRGAGLFNTTGRANFVEVEKATGLPVTRSPELLRHADTGTLAAMIFWSKRDLNRLADQGDQRVIRRVINGGTHGMDDMLIYYRRALSTLPEAQEQRPVALISPTPKEVDDLVADLDKGATESTTNIATLASYATSAGGVFAYVTDWRVQIALLAILTVAAVWVLRERRRKAQMARRARVAMEGGA